jgi:propanol-preferring alcohol dehydrogenase
VRSVTGGHGSMRAMVLEAAGTPLRERVRPRPAPGAHEVLVRVEACGVCRTDLHVVDGELADAKLPLVPGHEIVGIVERTGADVSEWHAGDRVGIPWLAYSCGECAYCREGRENLCDFARFTGYTADGGYAEYAVADARHCLALPADRDPQALAPWLCAGLIGYRALRFAGEGRRIGIYGFGAAAHMIAQVCRYQGREVFAFTRPGDAAAQRFAGELGALWAGGSDETPPEPLDAALIFAPVGSLVPAALRATARGGTVVCAGIHMSDIPSFPYRILWEERILRSVANLTRRDAAEFLALAPQVPVRTRTEALPLAAANTALDRLRSGAVEGALVLVP